MQRRQRGIEKSARRKSDDQGTLRAEAARDFRSQRWRSSGDGCENREQIGKPDVQFKAGLHVEVDGVAPPRRRKGQAGEGGRASRAMR